MAQSDKYKTNYPPYKPPVTYPPYKPPETTYPPYKPPQIYTTYAPYKPETYAPYTYPKPYTTEYYTPKKAEYKWIGLNIFINFSNKKIYLALQNKRKKSWNKNWW